ncbi:MAG TPA: glycosyltransferase family 39 protein [Chthoniobacterales bacterium]|nr:glycosyltransferase family 39 protein [Chthoniobacterales bacterium]
MFALNSRQFQWAVFAIVLLTVATRLPSLQHPQAIDDEAPYAVVANEIVDGGQPYIDAVDRKPPLLFWTYAAVFALAGKYNWVALHTVALIWTLATMAGLYAIARRWFDRETGLIAALGYSVFQPWAAANNLAFNGELLMNLPLVWAWAIAFGPSLLRLRLELLAAGALLAAGFLLKQPAAIAAVPVGIYLLLPSYRASRHFTKTQSVVQAAILTIGFFAVLGGAALVLQWQGNLREAFYWTFTNHSVPHVFWETGILITLAFIGCCWPLVIGAALAFRDRAGLWKTKSAERTALLGLLVASAIGAAAGGRFYPHYYLQLIPPLALLAAPYYARWLRNPPRSHKVPFRFLRPALSIWLAITVISFSISHWLFLAWHREPSESARYLSEHSTPDDRVFIWGGSAGEVYLHAHRRPACRYFVTFPLTGQIFGGPLPGVDTRDRIVPGAWSQLEDDFRKHPPLYIADHYSGPGAQYPVKDFPILARLLAEQYVQVARTPQGIIYRKRAD